MATDTTAPNPPETPTDPDALAGWIAVAKHYARIVTAIRVAIAEHEGCNGSDCGECVRAIRDALRDAERDHADGE